MRLKLSGRQWGLIAAGGAILCLALFTPASHSSVGDDSPSFGGLLVRASGALLVVIALLLGAAFFARKYGIASMSQGRRAGGLRVEEQVGLAGRQTLYVVRYGSFRYLVASGQQGVSLVARIKESPATSNMIPEPDEERI